MIEDEPSIRVDLETFADHFRVRVSLGNDALHKRGWRAVTGTLATLREDIACAALMRLSVFEPRALQASQISVPFAGDSTMNCAEMLPDAPGLFSTMIVRPSVFAMWSATSRA